MSRGQCAHAAPLQLVASPLLEETMSPVPSLALPHRLAATPSNPAQPHVRHDAGRTR
jgi:hypothetical protein